MSVAIQARSGQWQDYQRQLPARKKAGATIGYLKLMSVDTTTDPYSLITAPAAAIGPFFVCGTKKEITHTTDLLTGAHTYTLGAFAADTRVSAIMSPTIVEMQCEGNVQLYQGVMPATTALGNVKAWNGTNSNTLVGFNLGKVGTISGASNNLPNKCTDTQWANILLTPYGGLTV
jgi:hypothetical protein